MFFMKNKLFLIQLVLVIILLTSSSVLATTAYSWDKKIMVEYPAKIDGLKPFQIKLSITDAEIRKYTKEIRTESNCYNFKLLGEGTEYTPAAVNITPYNLLSHQNIAYNGEKEIILTLMISRSPPLEYNGYNETCSFRFFYIPDEETAKNFPLLKDGRTLTETQQIAEVNMNTVRSNYTMSIDLPESMQKAKYSSQTNLIAEKHGFQSDGIQYTIAVQLMRYGYTLDEKGMASYAGSQWKFDPYNVNYKEHFEQSTKISYEAGNIFNKDSEIKKLEISSIGNIKVEDAYYRTYSSVYDSTDYGRTDKKDMVQVMVLFHGQAYMNNAFVNFKLEKTIDTEKGTEDALITAAEQELLAMTKNYMITTKPIEELTLKAKNKKEENIQDPVIVGTVADADHNPMPYMKLQVFADNKKFVTTTTASGDFKITLTGVQIKENEALKARIAANFDYYRDGKNYFDIWYKNPANNQYAVVVISKSMNLTQQTNEIHIVFDGTADPSITASEYVTSWDQVKSLSVMYYHLHESVDFSLKKLEANIDYKLPVSIYVGNTDGKTLYSPDESEILISKTDSSYSSSNRPKNREYHEFAHHLMYATYGAWPAGRSAAGVKNHDGFLNANTGDSYLEGFAEFMAMAIAKEQGDKTPEIYASFGSQENNYKPWDSMGYDEEFAVSSLLWDLYDTKNDAGDSISMSLTDIWNVLKVNRKDFYEYYVAFKQANPSKEKEIDALFIAHGFYANPDVGNKKKDFYEGYKDANNDKNYTAGEFFVDYANHIRLLKYRTGMTIGKAANYERMNRSSAVRVPGAYIKVSDSSVRWYTIKVDLKDATQGADYEYTVDVRDGLIYVQPLPSGYEADITIMPQSQDYTSQKPYKTTATKLLEDIGKATNGYVAEHDFALKATGKHVDPVYYLYEDAEPSYEYEGDLGDMSGVEIQTTATNETSGFKPGIALVLLLLGGIIIGIGVIYLRKKKPTTHKHKK
jgi:hypothetical protein